jgi:hypothetical protein
MRGKGRLPERKNNYSTSLIRKKRSKPERKKTDEAKQ